MNLRIDDALTGTLAVFMIFNVDVFVNSFLAFFFFFFY
jgi:hypothetical protein